MSICFGGLWLSISFFFAIDWAAEISYFLPNIYVWWTIVGIALLPGFLMSSMFFSNLLSRKLCDYPDVTMDTTIILCAHNEEHFIAHSIQAIFHQQYAGHIQLLVVDNASTDQTKQQIMKLQPDAPEHCRMQYVYCSQLGKSYALNAGLKLVRTPYFITVDADTNLDQHAVQQIMNHIVFRKSACVAGNLFVQNATSRLISKMQNYDYLLSIAAIKRFQGSYQSTLVAQGAFSAYETEAVQNAGGWQNKLGEDIVLTYHLLQQGCSSTYEPKAVGYTTVPETFNGLYNQRKRWAIGMLEGLSSVPPWKQATAFCRYFVSVNFLVIYLDLAFLFGLIPGVILAWMGYPYFAGFLTLCAMAVCVLLYLSVYLYQRKLNIPFQNSLLGFLCFLLLFQPIQSTCSLHGYLTYLFRGRKVWK